MASPQLAAANSVLHFDRYFGHVDDRVPLDEELFDAMIITPTTQVCPKPIPGTEPLSYPERIDANTRIRDGVFYYMHRNGRRDYTKHNVYGQIIRTSGQIIGVYNKQRNTLITSDWVNSTHNMPYLSVFWEKLVADLGLVPK
jgi:hypothetical protein